MNTSNTTSPITAAALPLTKAIQSGLFVAALLFVSAPAHSQSDVLGRTPAAETAVQSEVAKKLPAVALTAVGRQVAPGEYEIDPVKLSGRRLTLPKGEALAKLKSLCIGKHNSDGGCKGIFIDFSG